MKIVYEASQPLDAHILQGYLAQHGIDAQVRGTYLQGAVGELPPGALTQLEVEDADFEEARRIIAQWEQTAIEPTPAKPKDKRGFSWWTLLLGIAVGCAAMLLFPRLPVFSEQHRDSSERVDNVTHYFSPTNRLLRSEYDRNLDGKIDDVVYYNRYGDAATGQSDDDFDGIFETSYSFENGAVTTTKVDTDGDGLHDLMFRQPFGVTQRVEYLNKNTNKPERIDYRDKTGSLVIHADFDTDNDGRLDTRTHFNRLGQVLRQETITETTP